MAASRPRRSELSNPYRNDAGSATVVATAVRSERRHKTGTGPVPSRSAQNDRHAVRADACGRDRDPTADDRLLVTGLRVLTATPVPGGKRDKAGHTHSGCLPARVSPPAPPKLTLRLQLRSVIAGSDPAIRGRQATVGRISVIYDHSDHLPMIS